MKVNRDQLDREGFCVFEGILDVQMLNRVRQASDRLLDTQDEAHFRDQRSTGSLISVYDDPFFAELATFPNALKVFNMLGFEDPKWASGYIISKPPNSPPLFWHQDWWVWDDPSSYKLPAQQLFFFLLSGRHGTLKRMSEGDPRNSFETAPRPRHRI